MRTSSPRRAVTGALGLVLVVRFAVGCGYDPKPEEGKLGCSGVVGGECPEGYSCHTDNKCWKTTSTGTSGTGGGTGGTTGTGGTGATPIDDYVGRWTFDQATSTKALVGCGADPTPMAFTDYMDVEVGPTNGTIKATYFCPWILSLPASGGAATVGQNQMCTGVDPTSKYVFTWKATTFTFTTNDGKSATLSALIPAAYVAPDASTGTCTIKIVGKLAK